MRASLLEIRLGLTTGGNLTFRQDDSVMVTKCLGRLHPDRAFAQPTLIIGGGRHVSVFPVAQIAHVEVRTELLPDWPFGTNFERIEVQSEELFQRGVAALADLAPEQLRVAQGEQVSGFAMLQSRGGFHYPLAFHARALSPSVRVGRIARFLEGSSMYARSGDDRAFLINLHNVVSMRVYPAIRELPPNAIEADEVVRKSSEDLA